jgi:hypothetical protein
VIDDLASTLRFSRLIRICAWCTTLLGISEPTAPNCTGISHGICAACAATFTQKEPRP